MVITTEVMPQERLDRYIEEAAQAAGYQEGFGVLGCDLNQTQWWVAYTRQSTREQAQNDRLSEYFLTCARLAKERGAIVPREYIIYDNVTSEHLGRPGMIWLRDELITHRRIAGVITPNIGRLSMEDLHRLTFEKQCQHHQIQFIYGDAPSGMDIGSMFARSGMSMGNYLRVTANRENALAGNIARILAGKVPAQKAPYGYIYRAEKTIENHTGKTRVNKAWWEINLPDEDGDPTYGSPAWAVRQIFRWLGTEGRTQYWASTELNRLGIKPPYGSRWVPKMIGEIVRRKCYTGQGIYNANARVADPNKDPGDLTLGVKRTILRPKPVEEWHTFTVPALASQHKWQMANDTLTKRGRGRGKQGKKVEALLRGRIICPICKKLMAVKRKVNGEVYYHCRSHYSKWLQNPCPYRRFIPGSWDKEIWHDICTMLRDDTWVEQQLHTELDRNQNIDRLIRYQKNKVNQYENKITRVEEGYDGGLYALEEARKKKRDYQKAIDEAKAETSRLRAEIKGFTQEEVEALRQGLKLLRDQNLTEATFEQRMDLLARLGITVYPSDDLKSRRISCQLNIGNKIGEVEQVGVTKGVYGRPYRSRTCDTLIKSMVLKIQDD